jgi:hypothetical protein
MVLFNIVSKTKYYDDSFIAPPRSIYVSKGYLLPSNVFVIEEEEDEE